MDLAHEVLSVSIVTLSLTKPLPQEDINKVLEAISVDVT
jgi:hypothetical protein